MTRTLKLITDFFSISTMVLLVGCVSVKIASEEVKKAENVIYKNPKKPFEKFSAEHLDAAWRNPKNGNSISYLSNCNRDSDPALDHVQRDILKGLSHVKIIESTNTMYNKRTTLLSTVEGEVDGVPSKLSLLIFKKNSCLYILTYVGLKNTFSADKAAFDQFVREFQAP